MYNYITAADVCKLEHIQQKFVLISLCRFVITLNIITLIS